MSCGDIITDSDGDSGLWCLPIKTTTKFHSQEAFANVIIWDASIALGIIGAEHNSVIIGCGMQPYMHTCLVHTDG